MSASFKNNNPIRLSVILFIGSLFLTNAPACFALETRLANGQVLDLYGIGIHQEKRNDIYLGAIFVSPGTEKIAQLLSEKSNKRMSFKFLSKYSNRKVSRLLKQRIAMNNSKEQWNPYTKEIVQFANLFKRSLQSGDEMNIDYTADKGTQIYLNNTLFQTVEKIGFYKILLKIWFGNIPPSESFKSGINGMNTDYLNDELIAKYNSLQAEVGRFDGDKIALATDTKVSIASAPTNTKALSSPANKTATNTQSKQIQPIVSQKKTDGEENAAKTDENGSTDTFSSLTPAAVAVSTPKIVLDSLAAAPVAESRPKKESSQASKDLKTADSDKTEVGDAQQKQNDINADKVAKVESSELFDLDLISGSYTQELFSIIRSRQVYPKKALRDGVEGNVVVKVTIDKEGEIVNQQILKRSGSLVLDRGVLKMLRRSGPFPKIPNELNLEEFALELPLTFQFTK